MEWSLFFLPLCLFCLNAFLVACVCCASGGLLSLLAQFPRIFIFLKGSHRLKKHFCSIVSNFLTLKLVFHNHSTPWLFLVNLTHLPVPPLKFPNPAPVLWLFTTLSSSFQPFLPLNYLHGMFFEFCVKLTEQIV
jgi:hypothetical protein